MQQDNVVRARNLPPDQAGEMVWFTGDEEMVLVWLGGRCVANWGAGAQSVGARENVFDGLPYSLYLPGESRVTLKAETVCEVAQCCVPSKAKLEPRLVTPND